MARKYWRGRDITDEDADSEPNLGPDEHDADLLDGSWEQEYYSPRKRGPDWRSIQLGVAIIVVIALVLPMILVWFQ